MYRPKSHLSETDICDRFITPALEQAGWTHEQHILREYALRPGRVVVRGQASHRDKAFMLRADYVLFRKPNVPLAVVEAKDAKHSVGAGMPQAIQYAELLGVPFSFASNGDGLRRLCADLRQRLAERDAVQARLAEALVASVTA